MRTQTIMTINSTNTNWILATAHDAQNKPIILVYTQQNYPLFALLDCGAMRSLITPNAFQKASLLWNDYDWKSRKINIYTQLVSATGGRINYQGNHLLDLHAAGRQIPHEFLTVEPIPPTQAPFYELDIILGYDFFRRYGAKLCAQTCTFTIGHAQIPLVRKTQTISKSASVNILQAAAHVTKQTSTNARFRFNKAITIPPHSAVAVAGKIFPKRSPRNIDTPLQFADNTLIMFKVISTGFDGEAYL